MDTAQWPQELLMKPSMEEMIPNTTRSSAATANTCSNIISNNNNNNNDNNTINNNVMNNNSKPPSTSLERKVRPQKDQAVNCPRCNSTNTKFCYYNNYSLTQPRYFCKTCRRYWTEGGSLRNIPVGGGSRKNKRSASSSSSSTSSASKKLASHHDLVASTQSHHHHHNQHQHHTSNPNKFYHQGQDLNLGFAPTHYHHHQQQEFRSLSEFMQLPAIETTPKSQIPNSGANTTTSSADNHHLSALELLNGLTSSRGLTPFMPMPVPDPNGVYSSGFQMHDFKPSLNFSLVDGLGNGYGSLQGEVHQQAAVETNNTNNSSNNGRLLFPFEDLKQVSSTTSADHNTNNSADNHHDLNGEQGDSTPGYWSGMLGNDGSW